MRNPTKGRTSKWAAISPLPGDTGGGKHAGSSPY